MTEQQRSPFESDTSGRLIEEGVRYEIVSGPASSEERTKTGALVAIDHESMSYEFELDDGTTVTLADDAIDSLRRS